MLCAHNSSNLLYLFQPSLGKYSSFCHTHAQTLPQTYRVFFNSLRPSDAIWRHRSGSSLAQVLACCLAAPSHYLNQYWLIISKSQQNSCKSICTRNTSATNHQHWLENYLSKISFKSPRGQRVTIHPVNCTCHTEAETNWLITFSSYFFVKIVSWIKFHWILFSSIKLTITQCWFR